MLIVPDILWHRRATLKRGEKSEEACLEGLKCLKKNLLLHCHLSLNCRKVFSIKSTLITSPQKPINRVSTTSTDASRGKQNWRIGVISVGGIKDRLHRPIVSRTNLLSQKLRFTIVWCNRFLQQIQNSACLSTFLIRLVTHADLDSYIILIG